MGHLLVFMAWRNIWRYPTRSLLTLLALATGLVMVILYAALLEGMSRQMVQQATSMMTGHIQVHRQAFIDNQDVYALLDDQWLTDIATAFPGVLVAPRVYTAALASTRASASGAIVKGVDPKREPNITQQSAWHVLLSEPSASPYPAVLLGKKLAHNLNVHPGDELVLVSQAVDGSVANGLFVVKGVLTSADPALDRAGVVMSVEAWREWMYLPTGVHELAMKIPEGDDVWVMKARIAQWLRVKEPLVDDAESGPPIARTWQEILPVVANMLSVSEGMLLLIGGMVVGLASLGMLNTMLMAIHERQHELATLLALGMSRGALVTLVIVEAFILALMAAAVGSCVAYFLGRRFEVTGIDFSAYLPEGYDWGGMMFEPVMRGYFLPEQFVQSCVLMIGVALVSAGVPAWRIARMQIVSVLR